MKPLFFFSALVMIAQFPLLSTNSYGADTKIFPEELNIQFKKSVPLKTTKGGTSVSGSKYTASKCFGDGKLSDSGTILSQCCIVFNISEKELKDSFELPSGAAVVTDEKDHNNGKSKWDGLEYNTSDWSGFANFAHFVFGVGGKNYTSHVTVKNALVNGKEKRDLEGFVRCNYSSKFKDDSRLGHVQNQFQSYANVTGSMPQEAGKTAKASGNDKAQVRVPANKTVNINHIENNVDKAQ